jgi:SOS-response transcriptional repressor LexA
MLVDVSVPQGAAETAGVLLVDPVTGTLYHRFRRDLAELSPEDADIFEELPADLDAKAREMGGVRLLEWLGNCASGFLRVSDCEEVPVESFDAAVNRLYRQYVRPRVLPFRTHLPVYSLQAAAGRWGPERDVETEPEEWIEAPPDLRRLTEDMFVARVIGRSMEPLIPDGSLCVFRAGVAGGRQGKRVLVANLGEPGDQRFTVKRYESVKRRVDDDREQHVRVILHPLNPEFDSWELDYEPFDQDSSGRVKVLAEFVGVLGD